MTEVLPSVILSLSKGLLKRHLIIVIYLKIKQINSIFLHSINATLGMFGTPKTCNKQIVLLKIVFAVLCLSLCLTTQAQVNFKAFKTIPTGSAPTVVCIGDLNNDGKNDVVLCTGFGVDDDPVNDNKSFVFIQNELGELSNPIKYPNSKFTPYAATICDVNNDSLNDLIIGYDDSIGVFFQNKIGTLNPIKGFYSGNFNRIDGLSTGDLNNDGLSDIAISHYSSSVITVLYQKISGGFNSISIASPNNSAEHVIEVGDINNDKRDDIVLSMADGLFVYTQTASGKLNPFVTYNNGNTNIPANGLAIGDLNNDGLKDIVQTISGETPNASVLHYLQDKKTNTILNPSTLVAYQTPEPVRIADLNCDKKNEIIVANGGTQTLTIYEQNLNIFSGYNTFTISDANHYNPYGLSIGDINNDGRNDIILADYKKGLIVLINESKAKGACCPQLGKLPIPTGKNAICVNGTIATYKSSHNIDDQIIWNLYPSEAGTIVSSNNDSCEIVWNDSWYGKASVSVKAYHTCATITSQPLVVTVHIPPLNIGNDTLLCANTNFTLHAGDNFDSYKWSNNATDSIITGTCPNIYFVQASNVCGSRYDTITLSAQASPNINLVSDSILCPNASITFDVTQAGNNAYIWQDGSDKAQFTTTKAGTYTVKVTNTFNCSSSKSVNVKALNKPNISLPNDTSMCDSISLPLQVQCPSCNYIWNNGNNSSTITAIQAGLYSVTATNVCGITTDNIAISLAQSPQNKLFPDTILCIGSTLECNLGTISGTCSYLWNDGSTDSIRNFNQAGNYSVTITNSNFCSSYKSANISENTIPQFLLPNDTSYCDSIQITIDITTNNCSYLWNDLSTNPQQTILKDGIYIVSVTNICGTKTDTLVVNKFDCLSYLEVPSAFSPNDDNLNDIIYALGRNVSNIQFKIFNRWGQLMFESNDLKKGWDGNLNGKKAEESVYVYYITGTSTTDNQTLISKGSITLIR